MNSTPDGLFGRTSAASSQRPIMLSDVSSLNWWEQNDPLFLGSTEDDGRARVWLLGLDDPRPGEFSILSISESPRQGGGFSSLADVLEMEPTPARYSLSRKACAGILRRIERREREIPAILREALEARAGPR